MPPVLSACERGRRPVSSAFRALRGAEVVDLPIAEGADGKTAWDAFLMD
jgi:hypothetical protein